MLYARISFVVCYGIGVGCCCYCFVDALIGKYHKNYIGKLYFGDDMFFSQHRNR